MLLFAENFILVVFELLHQFVTFIFVYKGLDAFQHAFSEVISGLLSWLLLGLLCLLTEVCQFIVASDLSHYAIFLVDQLMRRHR